MITIEGNEANTIRYSCDCGIKGECILKPQSGNRIIIVDIICPHCEDKERVKIIQYDTEENKKLLEKKMDLSWSVILENRIRN